MNWFLRRICWHIGQGAGPALKRRSIQDSHLGIACVIRLSTCHQLQPTFCESMARQGAWDSAWDTCHSCTLDIEHLPPALKTLAVIVYIIYILVVVVRAWYDTTEDPDFPICKVWFRNVVVRFIVHKKRRKRGMDWQATAARGSRNLAVATPQRSGSIDANLLLSNPRYMSCVLSYIASLSAPVIEELGWSYVEPYKDIKDIEYMKKSCDQDITLNQCIKGWFIQYQINIYSM